MSVRCEEGKNLIERFSRSLSENVCQGLITELNVKFHL